MGVNCLQCTNSACCKIEVVLSREEYNKFVALGYGSHVEKETDLFIKKNPEYEKRREFIDNLYRDEYARLLKDQSGMCVLIGENTLCSIYEDRPIACREYETTRCEKIRCIPTQ